MRDNNIAELEALREENYRLHQRVAQMEEIGEALMRAREIEDEKNRQLEEMQKSLKKALSAGRRQLEEISRVHTRFLPQSFPIRAGIQVAAHCRPCADVGGDFYDVFAMKDGRLAICMADVSGHGAVAAMAMATCRSLLRVSLLEATPEEGPTEILLRIARWLEPQFESEQFATMWLGVWDQKAGTLRHANAAHPSAILWRDDEEPEYMETLNGLPLGLTDIEPFPCEEGTVNLRIGDRVVLYTDAWNESKSSSGKVLEDEEFLDFIGNAYGQPLIQVPTVLFMMFERHTANSRIRDDVSLMVFERVE